MRLEEDIHYRRQSIRLKHYDYSYPGHYFVTICTQNHECIFGKITNGKMELNEIGEMVHRTWVGLLKRFPIIGIDEAFVVMPNHFHGIIIINSDDTKNTIGVGAGFPRPEPNGTGPRPQIVAIAGAVTAPLQRNSLGQIIAYFKYQSTKQINEHRNTPGWRVWQRNYYEHVIRDEDDLYKIREYIITNPFYWEWDENYL